MSLALIILLVVVLSTLLGSTELGALALIVGVLGGLAYAAWPA